MLIRPIMKSLFVGPHNQSHIRIQVHTGRCINGMLQIQQHADQSDCDQSFAFYDAIVGSTTDESMMRTSQSLTSSALDRIGILKQLAGNE